MENEALLALKEEKLRLLETKKRQIEELPHKYGFKMYRWQREFFECENKDAFLTAANQSGKSIINLCTAIEWCTNPLLWPRLWKAKVPRQIWYMYPSFEFATSEFEVKIEPDLLPRGSAKEDPVTGWKAVYSGRYIHSIKFNSGMTLYFKAYTQNISNLQGSTVAAIFCDEELPEEFWDELNQRRMFYNGYFRLVFTATLGQKFWYDVMERRGTPEEKMPLAWKKQVSLYDCMKYEDGTPSHVDEAYIKRAISLCKSPAEEAKRIWGRFASDEGLKYPTFDKKKNIIPPHTISRKWQVFIGVDVGSGSSISAGVKDGHPSAIVFCAVDPTYTKAVVFDGWLGSDVTTTDKDVFNKVQEMIEKNDLSGRNPMIFYDYHAKDFGTIAMRNGLPVERAEKRHDVGESILGVLFKTGNLCIFDKPCLDQLVYQLCNLKASTPKRSAVDDYIDGLRYALGRVPFDWSKIGVDVEFKHRTVPERKELTPEQQEIQDRRRRGFIDTKEENFIDNELEEWGSWHNDF